MTTNFQYGKALFSCNVYYGSVRKLLFSIATLKLKISIFAVFEKVEALIEPRDGVRDYL